MAFFGPNPRTKGNQTQVFNDQNFAIEKKSTVLFGQICFLFIIGHSRRTFILHKKLS